MVIKDILHQSLSKRLFRHRSHSLLRRADATGSVDIIYLFSVLAKFSPAKSQYKEAREEENQ